MPSSHKIYPIVLTGGLDMVTQPLSIPPGKLINCKNYEQAENGGYRRIFGFERYDGRGKPSDATYYLLYFDSGDAEIAIGTTITDGGAKSAIVVYIGVVSSGSYGAGTAAGYLIITNVVGTWVDNDEIRVSGVNKADVASGGMVLEGAATQALDDVYLQAAIEWYRDQIGKVGGASRTIRGVWTYNDVVYAFQNNAAGTACLMFKSSSTGWTQVDLGRYIAFTSGGTTAIVVNNVVVGAISAATATVGDVVVTTGAWADGNAAGYLSLLSQSGTFQAEDLNIQGGASNVATIAGNSTANALAASGNFEFVNYNFGGHTDSLRMFGCDGVSKAFSFNGTGFLPIITGMTTDTPNHITAHKNHLFLSFSGGSIQHSSTSIPWLWSVIVGAAEISIGDECTGFQPLPGGILAIYVRNSTYLLYGNNIDDWVLKSHSLTSGAISKTIQPTLIGPVHLDDRGIISLTATSAYGDFRGSTISQHIQSIIDSKKALVTASLQVRSKNQYRLFFSDYTGLYVTFGATKELFGITLVEFSSTSNFPVICCCSGENSSGNEILFFGSDNGYVYQMDAGTSFDGEEVSAFLRLPYFHYETPRTKKRFRRLVIEIDPNLEDEVNLTIAPDYHYGNPDIPDPASYSVGYGIEAAGDGGYWDESNWNEFYWSSQIESSNDIYIDGTAINMGILIVSTATYELPHTIQNILVHYSLRGHQR